MLKCSETNEPLSQEDKTKIKEIIDSMKETKCPLIEILHKVQDYYGYLPYNVQAFVANEMNVPLSDIYGVVTFYARFSTEPVGRNRISVCLGTACYVKGSQALYDALKEKLHLTDEKMITDDKKFSLDSARCVGACGLAPVVMINEDVYGKCTPAMLDGILAKYE
ncbi:MAG: NAD(P)H-dependent oxidoreductase subunit E [Clostridia bacterium]|nr:NAD(P)H-dependent oxidoreductase subunit E [Clostridia bacterium]